MATTDESGEILGPFTDMVQRATTVVWDTVAANTPGDLHPRTILLTLFIATLIFLVRRGHGARSADGQERKTGYLNFLLPKDIYTHISARVDIWLWVLERILRPLWAVSLFATVAPFTEQSVIGSLQWLFGETPALQINYAWMLLYSLVSLLCYDFVFYTIHYTMHKTPALWAIHKVHHSAEVLTPLTRSREHFLAGPIWAAGAAFSYSVAGGMFAYLFDGGITQATILNISFFALLFGFNGSFRHYHVQFHYPRWLSKWLQSPAMHHTHHSYLQKHWDTNLAAVTSIWDRMFGTMYIPEKDEYTPWGIGPKTQAEYRTFWQNTSGPFRDWYKMLRSGSSPQAGAVPGSPDLVPPTDGFRN
ncbi:MAG: sterol desaturase family protein [Proteobacteria bacterium]|nr:sterol desaturase family protein [Pseudomonadota bacterium]MDA0993663.1 sterol desaturase family protein [Pseudomonadota bacterium]